MSAVLEDLALQIVEPRGSDGMEEGARSTLRHSSARCSVYLLYWYKSTNSDAFFSRCSGSSALERLEVVKKRYDTQLTCVALLVQKYKY